MQITVPNKQTKPQTEKSHEFAPLTRKGLCNTESQSQPTTKQPSERARQTRKTTGIKLGFGREREGGEGRREGKSKGKEKEGKESRGKQMTGGGWKMWSQVLVAEHPVVSAVVHVLWRGEGTGQAHLLRPSVGHAVHNLDPTHSTKGKQCKRGGGGGGGE